MPPRANIPDDSEYHVKIGDVIMAKYCRHCGRFVKGESKHYTKDHTGTRNKFSYQGPEPSPGAAPAPAPAPTAAGQLANVSPTIKHVSFDEHNVPTISTQDFMCRETIYDFSSMPLMDLSAARDALLEDDEEGFFDALVKELDG